MQKCANKGIVKYRQTALQKVVDVDRTALRTSKNFLQNRNIVSENRNICVVFLLAIWYNDFTMENCFWLRKISQSLTRTRIYNNFW